MTVRAMDGAGAALLRAGALQLSRQVEVLKDARDRQLRLDMSEVDPKNWTVE
jgi:hypothetical protein